MKLGSCTRKLEMMKRCGFAVLNYVWKRERAKGGGDRLI